MARDLLTIEDIDAAAGSPAPAAPPAAPSPLAVPPRPALPAAPRSRAPITLGDIEAVARPPLAPTQLEATIPGSLPVTLPDIEAIASGASPLPGAPGKPAPGPIPHPIGPSFTDQPVDITTSRENEAGVMAQPKYGYAQGDYAKLKPEDQKSFLHEMMTGPAKSPVGPDFEGGFTVPEMLAGPYRPGEPLIAALKAGAISGGQAVDQIRTALGQLLFSKNAPIQEIPRKAEGFYNLMAGLLGVPVAVIKAGGAGVREAVREVAPEFEGAEFAAGQDAANFRAAAGEFADTPEGREQAMRPVTVGEALELGLMAIPNLLFLAEGLKGSARPSGIGLEIRPEEATGRFVLEPEGAAPVRPEPPPVTKEATTSVREQATAPPPAGQEPPTFGERGVFAQPEREWSMDDAVRSSLRRLLGVDRPETPARLPEEPALPPRAEAARQTFEEGKARAEETMRAMEERAAKGVTAEMPEPRVPGREPVVPEPVAIEPSRQLAKPGSIDIQINATPTKALNEQLTRLGSTPAIKAQLDRLGISRMTVEPAYKFGLSEQANVEPATGNIRISQDVSDLPHTVAHELAHDIYNRLDPAGKAAIDRYITERGIEPQHGGGLEERIADHFADVMLGKAPAPPEIRRTFLEGQLGERPAPRQRIESPEEIADREASARRLATPAGQTVRSWEQVAEGLGYLTMEDDLREMVRQNGDRMVGIKDIRGFRHRIPASVAAELLDSPANEFVREVYLRGPEMEPVKIDRGTVPELERAIEAAQQKALRAPPVSTPTPLEPGKAPGEPPVVTPEAMPPDVAAALDRWKKAFGSEKGAVEPEKPIDPGLLKDAFTIGRHYAAQGVKDFAQWSDRMVRELGDTIRPHLQGIWDSVSGKTPEARPGTVDPEPPRPQPGPVNPPSAGAGTTNRSAIFDPNVPLDTLPVKTFVQRVKAQVQKLVERSPAESRVLREMPDSAAISAVDRHSAVLADDLLAVLDQPFAKAIHEYEDYQWMNLEHQSAMEWRASAKTELEYNEIVSRLPEPFQEMLRFRDAKFEGDQQARQELGLELLPKRKEPYFARQTVAEFRDVVNVLGRSQGLAGDLQTTVKSFQQPRVFESMIEGIRSGKVEYEDPRVAWLLREWNSIKLQRTAALMKELESKGVIYRDKKAATAASPTKTAFAMEGLPGHEQTWWTRTQAERNFVAQNLVHSESSVLSKSVSLMNQLFRNPNLYNPLPHFAKNMLYKYGMSGGGPRVAQRMIEFLRNENPEEIARFKEVMPSSESGRIASDVLQEQIGRGPVQRTVRLFGVINKPSSRALFQHLDPALRYARWRQYREAGMSAQEAANNVTLDLIRYGTRSDITDNMKAIPGNFFVPWRYGTVTALVKAIRTHPMRTALFVAGVDLVRELYYRHTGRWVHLPVDYVQGPLVQAIDDPEMIPFIAATTAIFGPGGAFGASMVIDMVKTVQGTEDWHRIANMFWGISQAFDIPREAAAFERDHDPQHIVNILTGAAIGTHPALSYEPRRLMKYLPDWIPPFEKAEIVKQAERLQRSIKEKRQEEAERKAERQPGMGERFQRFFDTTAEEEQIKALEKKLNPSGSLRPPMPPRPPSITAPLR